ncbi:MULTISPECIES: TIGR04283 family arsenosugar biosynthesis glycosyltransferase [unclassified Campylobacter]|uniref:TIGR04283 family arsenosugar biosynthesis glycosyltransferase n=1 Tax=unclassified Campylobacter TaxID=2593542 RepID=UPI001451C0B0|nr:MULTISPECIES: TIGR04283 family arsenosugar biosynthesis glycosyltransferase [unclassified Campylobacter]QCD53140.1 glycosyltransferase, family 2 [Campylobacter sp. RM16192]
MISVIVPIYNESIENIKRFEQELNKQEGEFEVIFVDASKFIYKSKMFKVIPSLKGRGIQQNLGVRESKFEKILFLHVDSSFEDSDAIIKAAKALDHCKLGCFKMKFDDSGIILSIISFFSNLRVKFKNIAFGDQGIFISKSLFDELGGFKEIALMEDLEFSIRARKQGLSFYQLSKFITTSARKFKKEGILKTIIKMQILQYQFKKGISIDEIAKKY